MNKELCDIQNEESEQLIADMRAGKKQMPINKPYDQGHGPNPDIHDNGLDDIKSLK